MVELRRTIKCSNCGTDTNFYLSSELALSELLVHGRCQRCGNSLQLNFNVIDQSGQKVEQQAAQASAEPSSVNLDETLFNEPADIPSDTIRDLIES